MPFNYSSFNELLLKNKANYLTSGLNSVKKIEDSSIDFIFSNAALEHIEFDKFAKYQRELHRILKPNGIISHDIDLRDHLGGNLNNLRFSQKVWESKTFRNSGFYTNRIRFDEMVTIFSEVGFKVKINILEFWEVLPIRYNSMAERFKKLDQSNMNVAVFNVVLKK